MKIADSDLLKELEEIQAQIYAIKQSDPYHRRLQAGVEKLQNTHTPITSKSFRNIEFHPTYNSLLRSKDLH